MLTGIGITTALEYLVGEPPQGLYLRERHGGRDDAESPLFLSQSLCMPVSAQAPGRSWG